MRTNDKGLQQNLKTSPSAGIYPLLNGSLHLTPEDGFIYPSNFRQTGRNKSVNRSASEILYHCDGSNPIEGIIEKGASLEDEEPSEIAEMVRSFIEKAAGEGDLILLDSPSHEPLKITGSWDYWVPDHLNLELTHRCNLKCKHCYIDAGPNAGGNELPTDQLLKLLKMLASHGSRTIELTGGEPMIHPDFLQIVECCASNFEITTLATNGYFIDEEMASKLALHRNRVLIQLSIDGMEKYHDDFRGVPGSWRRTLNALKLLVSKGIKPRVAMVLTRKNIDQLDEVATLVYGLGARSFTYSPAMNIGRGEELDMDFLLDEQVRLGEIQDSLLERYGDFIIGQKEPMKEEKELTCGAGYRQWSIGPNGIVRPCLLMPDTRLSLGNLAERGEELFKDPIIERLKDLGAPRRALCYGCEHERYCRGCIVRGISQYEKTPDCKWAKATGLDKLLGS